jgi:hypothetical protein
MDSNTGRALTLAAVAAVFGVALYNGPPKEAPRQTVAMPTDPESQAAIFAAAREEGKRTWSAKTTDQKKNELAKRGAGLAFDAVGAEIRAKRQVTAALRDPGSAQFGRMIHSPKHEGIVCGEVNARNGFGGYTGMQPYIAGFSDGALLLQTASETAAKDVWAKYCK